MRNPDSISSLIRSLLEGQAELHDNRMPVSGAEPLLASLTGASKTRVKRDLTSPGLGERPKPLRRVCQGQGYGLAARNWHEPGPLEWPEHPGWV